MNARVTRALSWLGARKGTWVELLFLVALWLLVLAVGGREADNLYAGF